MWKLERVSTLGLLPVSMSKMAVAMLLCRWHVRYDAESNG